MPSGMSEGMKSALKYAMDYADRTREKAIAEAQMYGFSAASVPNSPDIHAYDALKYMQAQQNSVTPTTNINEKLRQALFSRLEVWQNHWLKPQDFLMCFNSNDRDTVHVFFVFGKETGVLEDDKHMFPSDELITQLRLLRG